MLSRVVDRPWGTVLIGAGLVGGSAALYSLYGPRALAAPLAVALIYLAMKLGAGTLAQLSARTRLSLRWKVTGAISLMLVILLGVSLASLAASNYMHSEVHAIQQLRDSAPIPAIARALREAQGPEGELLRQMQVRLQRIPAALDRLENRQHLILTWIPAVIFGGGLVALALGMALSSLLIRSIRQMSEATRRIASGDFSQPVDVPNRDELGELTAGLNNAAQDLGRLQEALLAEERARSLQQRIAQATLAQEEERRRISRELHDGLGPSLADLGNRLSVCRQLVRDDPRKAEAGLDEVTALLRGHIEQIRELINQLRPLALDQLGLVGALRQNMELFGEESGIDASLTISGSLPTDLLADVTIYRVVQESLTNVRRHAQATVVQVTLRGADDSVEVTVSDDGQGFNPEKAVGSKVKGTGLTSMRERAELVGGSFTVQSQPDQGCRTVLRIPARR